MTRLPTDPDGYLVEPDGTLHTRYADHAEGRRTRTEAGVRSILDGTKPKPCADCYAANSAPPASDTPRPPQRRRVQRNGDGPTRDTDRRA